MRMVHCCSIRHRLLWMLPLSVVLSPLGRQFSSRSKSFVAVASTKWQTSLRRRHSTRTYSSSLALLLTSSLSEASSNGNGDSSTIMPSSSSSSSSSSLFWNREESKPKAYCRDAPIIKEARIISLATPGDTSNGSLHTQLPEGATILAEGTQLSDFDLEELTHHKPNVIFISTAQPETLAALIEKFQPHLEWIHARSAGLDAFMSPTLKELPSSLPMTNAKGSFSSTLAEYTLLACGYFAKDLPRLLENKTAARWEKYSVSELRGARLGIVGYGDIGRAAAKLATAYGMNVVALRRRLPSADQTPKKDPYCNVVLDNSRASLNRLFSECDYVLCSAPLTDETKGMIGQEQFDNAKDDLVFLNVGRGPIVDEEAMIAALKDGRLKGAGLDVFATEPLSEDSELWKLPNVLLSPHNMDQTDTFMAEACQFFVEENLPRFLRGETLLNPVDPRSGY